MENEADRDNVANLQRHLLQAVDLAPPYICSILVPILTKAHEDFMVGKLAQSFELYSLAKDVLSSARGLQQYKALREDPQVKRFSPSYLSSSTSFRDVAGNNEAKNIIGKEFIFPVKHPHVVLKKPTGVLAILLFGPPGCGKSLIAQAAACEAGVPFYNILSSQLESKWRGESEKAVTALFEELRSHKACIVFLDEVEALMGVRNDNDNMSKMKSLFLQLMDGIKSRNSESFIMLLAATNLPEQIDTAFLSRFQHKIFVRLPTKSERLDIVVRSCQSAYGVIFKQDAHEVLQKYTKGYSGRDISTVIATFNYIPLEKVLLGQFFRRMSCGKFALCTANSTGAIQTSSQDIGMENIVMPPITEEDILQAFEKSFRQGHMDSASKYMTFALQHGIKIDSMDNVETDQCTVFGCFSHCMAFFLDGS